MLPSLFTPEVSSLVRYPSYLRSAGLALSLILSTTAFAADAPLFPQPLHLTRELADSISQHTSTVEEYCEGNRVISIRGPKTVIADYGQQTLTTIDRTLGTYSIARFDQVAQPTRSAAAKASSAWRVKQAAAHDIAARTTTAFELDRTVADEHRSLRVSAAESIHLSRAAVEILIGNAYPSPRREEADALLASLKMTGAAASSSAAYRLPLEEISTWEIAGEKAETRNTIVRIGSERAPVDLASIPPGARRVEPESRDTQQLLKELDTLPERR
jgi:hypothetical protein